ncbi:MAG: hypothetical protein D6806_07245 [Deltaproteobacteria bacterium]|nr:MAG: hypothetical protein D6806_07245 [Deltaproteobacteria bacterium]
MSGRKTERRYKSYLASIPAWVWTAILSAVSLPVLVGGFYGLDILGYPPHWWRDNPFDYGNILHMAETLSWKTRLWAWDPLHMFGWTPHVFYNPFATFLAVLFCLPFGLGPGAYKAWLFFLLWLTSLAGYALVPRRLPVSSRILAGFVFAFAVTIIFPQDVGILDANPVQVLYTGQWAQRLGIFFGLAALCAWMLAYKRYDVASQTNGDPAEGARWRRWVAPVMVAVFAGAFAGASAFSHYMSGYATFAACGLFALWKPVADRLSGRKLGAGRLLLFPALLLSFALLWFDFLYVFLSLNPEYHSLPMLRWDVPDGARMVVLEPLLAMLPVILLPLVGLFKKPRNVSVLMEALFPLAVFALSLASEGPWMIAGSLAVTGLSLLSVRATKKPALRFFLPVAASWLWLISCGPESLRLAGADLSTLVPFSSSLGWAKLAAFSRWLWIGWLALVAAEQLAATKGAVRNLARLAVAAAMLLPLLLSVSVKEGAHLYFEWMNDTNVEKTDALIASMVDVARNTPPDGYLLIEDTLHHGDDSTLGGRQIPYGHLPYLVAAIAKRPVFGGCVTTRYVTHPLARTLKGGLLRTGRGEIVNFARSVDWLRNHGVSDMLLHSADLVSKMKRLPGAMEVKGTGNLVHFRFRSYRPALATGQNDPPDEIAWGYDRIELDGSGRVVGLFQYLPFLTCKTRNGRCALEPFLTEHVTFESPEKQNALETRVTWASMEPAGSGNSGAGRPGRIVVRLDVPAWPAAVQLASWIAIAGAFLLRRLHARRRLQAGG